MEEKNLSNAFNLYNDLENKEYAPLNNSYSMLKKIKKYHKDDIRELSEDDIDDVNVGLLAAKALDFDEAFTEYAQLLHDIWSSFLSFLRTSYSKYPNNIPPGGSKRAAYQFYINQGFTSNQAKNHMQGIDFSKTVDAKFDLNSGDQVAQWRNPKITTQGGYYCNVGQQLNRQFSCLGIYYKQEDYQGNVAARIEHKFCLQRVVTCLKSYAADVLDTWSISNQPLNVKGGCIQYFYMKNKNLFKQILP